MGRCDRRLPGSNAGVYFRKSALALLVGAATHSAMAQQPQEPASDSQPTTVEEVVVYGIKQSLQNAQDLKRDAATVKDVITASDITALPDKSVVDALKRMPGVQVEVFVATDDPEHFGAEGSTALIRGLNRTLTEFNGRSTFSARRGGGLDLSNIPAELVGGIEVSKNQTADMIAGGIAGTLNLITRKPFDADGMQMGGSVKATYGDVIDDVTPELSALFSNRWDTDIGEIGFLVSAAKAKFTQRSEGVGAHNFYERRYITDAERASINDGNPDEDAIRAFLQESGIGMPLPGQEEGTVLWMPPTVQARLKEDERNRSGFSTSVQWAAPNERILATLEYIRSESDYVWHERLLQNRDSLGDQLGNANASTVLEIDGISGIDESFDPNTGLFTHGFITSPGTGYEAHTRWHGESSTVNDVSLNVEWNLRDDLIITGDLHYVESKMRLRDHSIMNGFISDTWLDLRDADNPQVAFVGRGFGATVNDSGETVLSGDTTSITNSENINLRSAMDHDTDSVGEQLAFAADVEYLFDNDWLTSIKGGVRFSDRDQTHKETNFDWGNISPEWSPENFRSAADYPQFQEVVDFGSDFHGGNGFAGGVTQFYFPRLTHTRDLTQFEAQINSMTGDPDQSVVPVRADATSPWIYPPGHARAGELFDTTFIYTTAEGNPDQFYTQESAIVDGKAYGSPFAPSEIFQVAERQNSAYVQLNFATDEMFIPLRGNIGLRYVDISITSTGNATFDPVEGGYTAANRYNENTVVTGFPDANWPEERDNLEAFLSGSSTPLSAKPDKYREVLPSLNLTFNLAENVLLRFAASKAIFIPEVVDLRNSLIVSPVVDIVLSDPEAAEPVFESVAFRGYEATSVGDSNPYLRPEESINLDLSAEWYFSDVGSLTFVVFNKELKNLIRTGQSQQQVTNPTTGVTQNALVRGMANVGEASIQGFEFAYQQTFDFLPGPWSGLGVQANYTYLDTEEDVGNAVDTSVFGAFTDLPLNGLSEDSYNLVAFYEANSFSTRLAYNWRSAYMLDDRDVIAARPVYNDDRGELDFSFSYRLNDIITAGLDINNLLDVQTRTQLQYAQDGSLSPRNYFVNDRRLSLRLSASF